MSYETALEVVGGPIGDDRVLHRRIVGGKALGQDLQELAATGGVALQIGLAQLGSAKTGRNLAAAGTARPRVRAAPLATSRQAVLRLPKVRSKKFSLPMSPMLAA